MSTTHNILHTLARQTLGLGLRLGSTVVIARALGPTDNGRYAIALLVPTLLTGALNLGIPAASAHHVARRSLTLAQACRMNAALWLGLCCAGALAAWLATRQFGLWLSDLPLGTWLLASAIFPVTLASGFAAGLLQGAGDFARYNRGLLIAPLGAASIALALAFAAGLDLPRALLAQLAAELASLAYLAWSVRSHLQSGRSEQQAPAAVSFGALLGFGGLAHLSTLLMLLNYRTDLFMVEWLIGSAAVGIYVIAVRIAEQLWLVSHAMATVLLPALSSRAASAAVSAAQPGTVLPDEPRAAGGPSGEQVALISSACRTALWASAALALAVAVLHPLLLALFGPSYRAAAAPLLCLLPGAALLGGARVAGVAMTALGMPQRNLAIALAVLVCNVPLNLLLVPTYRESGAACATSVSYALGCFVALGLLRSATGAPLRQLVMLTAADLQRGKRIARELAAKV